MRLYFVRHGESEANVLREFSISDTKHPLTPLGVQQAQALAGQLAGENISKIYSSPVLRARQTAGILSEALHAPVELTEALREWSVGILEGTTAEEGWQMHRQVQEDWYFHHKLENRIPGGESYLEMRARFVPFIEELIRTKGSTDERLVLVAHGGIYIAMLPEVLANITHEFAAYRSFPNTAYALAESGPGGLTCLEWCGIKM